MARLVGKRTGSAGLRPFETATIARIYMMQGMLDRAEKLFSRLLEADPANQRAREGLEEVRRRRRKMQKQQESADLVELAPQGGTVLCRWRVSEQGLRRARLAAGLDPSADGGRLALRMAAFQAEPRRPPRDVEVQGTEGSITVRPPQGAVYVAAAVGLLLEGGRFVSSAHCGPVALTGEEGASTKGEGRPPLHEVATDETRRGRPAALEDAG